MSHAIFRARMLEKWVSNIVMKNCYLVTHWHRPTGVQPSVIIIMKCNRKITRKSRRPVMKSKISNSHFLHFNFYINESVCNV